MTARSRQDVRLATTGSVFARPSRAREGRRSGRSCDSFPHARNAEEAGPPPCPSDRSSRSSKSQPTLEGAGVKLHRAFGFGQTTDFDPFLLFDDFRNDRPDDYRAGFPWHPHRGIETITYVLAGTVEHGDSLGNKGRMGAGDVQWMTAGSGILHQEMPQGDERGRMHGFQLWANLPSSLKMTAPRYQDIPAVEIPEIVDDDGTRVRVICGDFWGKRGPVDGIAAEPRYLDISVPAGKRKTLPVETGRHAFAYVFEGSGTFADASQPFGVLTEKATSNGRCPGARADRQPVAGAVRQRRRGHRAGRRRRHPVSAGLRQADRGAGGVVRPDRDEHATPSFSRRWPSCATAPSSSTAERAPLARRRGRSGHDAVGHADGVEMPELRRDVLHEQLQRAGALLARCPVLAGHQQQRAEPAGGLVELLELAGDLVRLAEEIDAGFGELVERGFVVLELPAVVAT